MPVQFDFVWSTRYSPVFLWVCLALSCPDVFIKDYYLSLPPPRLRVPRWSSCVHRDRRPDLKVSGAPSHRFVRFFWKVFVLFLCLSVPRHGSRHSSFRSSPRHLGVGVQRDRRDCGESAGRAPSSPPIAGDIRRRPRLPTPPLTPSPPFAGVHAAVRSSPSPPFAGDDATVHGSPSPPFAGDDGAVRGSPQPAGPPLTQARRIDAVSSPPARHWLKARGSSPHVLARSAVLSCAVSTGAVLIQSSLVLSTKTRLGQAALLVMAAEAIPSRLPPCRRSGGGRWGILWGPLTPGHAQKKPQPPS